MQPMARGYRFEVAVSFADEDRDYVRQVVEALHREGVSVFYDVDHEVELWGRDLVADLDRVYRFDSEFVVIFVSRHYVRKQWTRHELRSALARAIRERREYVLPARFDDSDVPGLPPTVRHVSCRGPKQPDGLTPDELAATICRKLGRTP